MPRVVIMATQEACQISNCSGVLLRRVSSRCSRDGSLDETDGRLQGTLASTGLRCDNAHMEIYKQFKFEAAHSLPHLPEGHKCRNLHGHSYRLIVFVAGEINPETGWIIDFAELKRAVDPLIKRMDHQNLNDIPDIGVTTAENLARWIWGANCVQLCPGCPGSSCARQRLQDVCTPGHRFVPSTSPIGGDAIPRGRGGR